MNTVSKDNTIQELLEQHPEKKFVMITTLSSYGLNCVGPQSDLPKTLEQAMKDKGYPEDKLAVLLNQLNHLFPSKDMPLFQLTKRAEGKLQQLLAQDQKTGWGLRFALKPGGCSGFEYDLDFQEKPEQGQKIYGKGRIPIFVFDRDLEKLKHSIIDYDDGLKGRGFEIQNPNTKGSCGCGESSSF